MLEISKYQADIDTLCKSHNVNELYIFGSSLSRNFSNSSDIDLLVEFQKLSPVEYAINYFDLKFSLQKIFGRNIDLLEKKTLKNPYLINEIDNTKRRLYAAWDQNLFIRHP